MNCQPKRAKCWKCKTALTPIDFPVPDAGPHRIYAPESDYEPKRAMR